MGISGSCGSCGSYGFVLCRLCCCGMQSFRSSLRAHQSTSPAEGLSGLTWAEPWAGTQSITKSQSVADVVDDCNYRCEKMDDGAASFAHFSLLYRVFKNVDGARIKHTMFRDFHKCQCLIQVCRLLCLQHSGAEWQALLLLDTDTVGVQVLPRSREANGDELRLLLLILVFVSLLLIITIIIHFNTVTADLRWARRRLRLAGTTRLARTSIRRSKTATLAGLCWAGSINGRNCQETVGEFRVQLCR